MANPDPISCPANTWTKVASNVVVGNIWKKSNAPNVYLSTFRVVSIGDPDPTESDEGVPIFRDQEPDFEEIKSQTGIDVWIYAKGKDGRVRVDI